jgi:cold shock CspA family protein
VTQPSDKVLTGEIAHQKPGDNFCFIKQDSGDANMFCLPQSCVGFGSQIPPIGTRIQYKVQADARSGRPKAEEVYPLQ